MYNSVREEIDAHEKTLNDILSMGNNMVVLLLLLLYSNTTAVSRRLYVRLYRERLREGKKNLGRHDKSSRIHISQPAVYVVYVIITFIPRCMHRLWCFAPDSRDLHDLPPRAMGHVQHRNGRGSMSRRNLLLIRSCLEYYFDLLYIIL